MPSRWLRAQQSLHQEKRLFLGVLIVTCPTCGATPCHNPTFCAACSAADRRAAEARRRQSPHCRPTAGGEIDLRRMPIRASRI